MECQQGFVAVAQLLWAPILQEKRSGGVEHSSWTAREPQDTLPECARWINLSPIKKWGNSIEAEVTM